MPASSTPPVQPSEHSSTRSPGSSGEVEQVGLGVVHAVDGPQDDVAVRVDLASASVMRPSSMRVWTNVWSCGELPQLAAAQQVGAAVADVGEAEPVPVEHAPR